MKFRVKEVVENTWFFYLRTHHRIPIFYPQYRWFFFWLNFKEWTFGPKWASQYIVCFKYKDEAKAFLENKQ